MTIPLRELVQTQLESAGYRVRVAATGEQAWRLLRRHPGCQMVLLDLVMPGWRGLTTVEQILAIQPKIPIITMSGFDRYGELPALQRRGIYGFLQKPFLLEELLQIARSHLPENQNFH